MIYDIFVTMHLLLRNTTVWLHCEQAAGYEPY